VSDSTPRFYDELAELYHLVYADWERSIGVQAAALSSVIRKRWRPAQWLLDAACGIGTQTLGLAAAGFTVTGSDVSVAALARASREAEARGLRIDFRQADLRRLTSAHLGPFDVVIACDNAVPHLLTREEILVCFQEMRALLRPGGGCLVSARDYSTVPHTGVQMIPYGTRETPEGRVSIFQLWDFVDPDHYDLSMYFVHDDGGQPRTQVFRSQYHAVSLDVLEQLLAAAGFIEVERITDRFFQPLLAATNPR
jgi:SAM-dependent methyltransferase